MTYMRTNPYKIYVDTSVLSAYFDLSKPVRQIMTKKWFENDMALFDPYVSTMVLDEIENNSAEVLKKEMFALLDSFSFTVLALNQGINDLSSEYRKAVIKNQVSDSLHIATASYYGMGAIVSWNFKHIVNLKTINAIHQMNLNNNYGILEILTIEQLGGHKYGNL